MSFGGKSSSSRTKSSSDSSVAEVVNLAGMESEGLEIDDAAVDKIVQDILGSDSGLASIFAGEQSSGLYNSSTSALAAGDLTASIVGEIAKLRAKKVKTTSQDTIRNQTSKTSGRESNNSTEFDIGIGG